MSKTTLHPEIQLDDTAADWYDGHAQAASQVTVAPSSLENNDTKYDEPAPPPDGGIKAWLQVLASWSLFFNTWGIVNTFGVYQTYYESGALFAASSSSIAWIGSVQIIVMFATCALVGPIYDRGGYRWLLFIGSFGIVFGHMMLSLSKTYWEAILTQGMMVGIGGGCLFVPAVAIMPTYFSSKLGTAYGLASSGSSLGGVIYPMMFYHLTDQIGFGWSTRILGFTSLVTLIIPLTVLEMRVKPTAVRSLVDWTAFTDGPFMAYVVGTFFGFTGCYVAFFYISYFGQASGITDTSLSFYLVPILNAVSIFGRIIPGWLSDKIGLMNIMAPCAFMLSIVLFCLMAVVNVGGLVVTTLLLGFFSAVFVALPSACFVMLTNDKSKIGTRIGMGLAMSGCGAFLSGPGGGAILGANKSNQHFGGLWIFAGSAAVCSGFFYMALRIWKGGVGLRVKV